MGEFFDIQLSEKSFVVFLFLRGRFCTTQFAQKKTTLHTEHGFARPVLPVLGRSAHGTAPLFFSLSTAQIHSWTGLGGRGPGNVAPEKLPVFLDLPRILVAPALRHKAPQHSL